MTMGRAGVRVEFEPRFCANHVVDLTAGCSFGCIYCPFSDLAARRRGARHPVALEIDHLDQLPAPASVFLSPASDPFAPQAAAGTHALLTHLLPRGTNVGILTKGVIPDATLDLLAAYPRQIEGVAIGVTSLDDRRNAVLEPGCPPAHARLANLDRIAERGLIGAIRIDPMFPDVDDRPESLDEAARRGCISERERRDGNLRLRVGSLSPPAPERATSCSFRRPPRRAGSDGGRNGLQRSARAQARDVCLPRSASEGARSLLQYVRLQGYPRARRRVVLDHVPKSVLLRARRDHS